MPRCSAPPNSRSDGASQGRPATTCSAHYGRNEPLRKLTAPQRRQLDDEADLMAAVMGATATLTVGVVTVGPHA
jgi:hypothetical protein